MTQPLDLPPVSETVTQDMINAYAEISGDYNPLHVDQEVAAASEFGGTIAHGPIALQVLFRLFTEGLSVEALPPGTTVSVTYRAPVRPGDKVTARSGDSPTDVACVNQDGAVVVSASVELPSR